MNLFCIVFCCVTSLATEAYKQVDIEDGKPVVKGWTIGKVVQRCHYIMEDESGVYVVCIRYRYCLIA